MRSLRDWLQAHGLGQYSDKAHANGIDLDVIASHDDADLRELGLIVGDCRRFHTALVDPDEIDDLLAPVFAWSTGGIDIKDLKEAKVWLQELAA